VELRAERGLAFCLLDDYRSVSGQLHPDKAVDMEIIANFFTPFYFVRFQGVFEEI